MSRKGRKVFKGYAEDFTMHEIYDEIKRRLHLTDSQMHKSFPDVCRARQDEDFYNLTADARRTRLKIIGR